MTTTDTRTFVFPAKHASDWAGRCGDDEFVLNVISQTSRTITLELNDAALRDLISDTHYYAEEMGRSNTGDIDYRPAARTLLKAFDRLGITYERKGFHIILP